MRRTAALITLIAGVTLVALAFAAEPAKTTSAKTAAKPAAAAPTLNPPANAPTLSSNRYFPGDDSVRSILERRVEAGMAPGLVVGLLEADGTMRCVTYGRSDGPNERPLDGNTLFEIGSITKVFTATLLADMVRRGEVRLGQSVDELLPDSVVVPFYQDTLITLADLASQHSGLPRLPTNIAPKTMENPYVDYTAEMLYRFLTDYRLRRAPGTKYEYSNLGVGLLGHALTRVAGKPYEELVVERVLKPLHLEDTRITLSDEQKSRFAAGHDAKGAVTPYWDGGALEAATAFRSSASDMLSFLAACIDSNDTPISAALRMTRYPIHTASTSKVSIGLAWHRMDFHGSEIIMHNGGTGGFRSFIGYDPAMRAGVVVLANGIGEIDDIGFHLLNPRFPLRAINQQVAVDSTRLEGLVGRYSLNEKFGFTITRSADTLFAQPTNQSRVRIYPDSDTSAYWRNTPSRVTFTRDSTGKAFRLTLHQRGRVAIGPRVEDAPR